MPPKQQQSNEEIKALLTEISEKLTIMNTPEKLRHKVSEFFQELRDAKSVYDSQVDAITEKLSSILNDPSIWI